MSQSRQTTTSSSHPDADDTQISWEDTADWGPSQGSQQQIDDKIRDAGYEPYPNTDAVDTDLYRQRLTDWLNKRAGFAFVTDQTPVGDEVDGDEVDVEFELPFGGTFTRRFQRPDSAESSSTPPYTALLETAGLTLDDLESLEHRRIPVQITDNRWEVVLERPQKRDSHLLSLGVTFPLREWPSHLRWLVFNRVVTLPLATAMVTLSGYGDAVDSMVYVVGGVIGFAIICLYWVASSRYMPEIYSSDPDEQPGWVKDD